MMMTATGCGSAATNVIPKETHRNYPISYLNDFDTVWERLMSVLIDLGYSVITADKERGIIESDFILTEGYKLERIAFIPRGELGTAYTKGRYKIEAKVKNKKNHTIVKINAYTEALQDMVKPYAWHIISSKGIVEYNIISELDEALIRY